MRILALQPYNAASHRAFLDGWSRNSRHTFEVLALPGRHFKWRMRQAPVALAKQVEALAAQGQRWDAMWCTSMLDLATLRGLSPAAAKLPAAIYFHENQLAYPVQNEQARDLHFGLTNMTSALAAIASNPKADAPCIAWNSAYNRDSFLQALTNVLQHMPDHRPTEAVEQIRQASTVIYPGIDLIKPMHWTGDNPPIILWAARWEYDKGPDLFFQALDVLVQRGFDFRLGVIGEQFDRQPDCFAQAKQRFADRITWWGYQQSRSDYALVLRMSDVIVSTSQHEFFGLAVAEAVSTGCKAVLPHALAYPEVWGDAAVYHDQTPAGVADAIQQALNPSAYDPTATPPAERFAWSYIAPQLDDALEALL